MSDAPPAQTLLPGTNRRQQREHPAAPSGTGHPGRGRSGQADGLRTHIDDLQDRLREAETHLAITRKTVTGLAVRIPASPPELPKHPDYARILTVFNEATGPLRAKGVCQALGHELLPKNVEGTRAKLKRLVKLSVLTEAETGSLARKQ